jgi:NADPH:quinone reductase-like Zn-dependent oxidoreductase
MRAVVLTGYGGVERLQLREVPRPEPGAGQILVRVRAAGVNPIDWKIRSGRLRLLLPAHLPVILGFDVAGEVAAIGPEVAGFEPGDAVFAMLDDPHGGGYAEYAVAGRPAVARLPEGLSFEEAAAMPLAALTALQALRDLAELQSGERLAVYGAAGGVGHFAVQIGVAMGARVVAAGGPGQQDYLGRLGAERTVDVTREDITALPDTGAGWAAAGVPLVLPTRSTPSLPSTPGGPSTPSAPSAPADITFDAFFDAAGALRFGDCEPALAAGGVFVTTRHGPSSFIAHLRSRLSEMIDRDAARRAATVRVHPSGSDLDQLAGFVEAGRLRPRVERVYPLAEAARAHDAGETGGRQGKLVLRIDG